ncbi:hypothetical protein K9M59_02270 [Candidatus Gracilibacteria bacterium]|nr:hypothetical protein [Candidatus Gracilibacteria bacterium]MCF7819668.1 hypothetical protein [Candidatus Gracilibacteria bacterium]
MNKENETENFESSEEEQILREEEKDLENSPQKFSIEKREVEPKEKKEKDENTEEAEKEGEARPKEYFSVVTIQKGKAEIIFERLREVKITNNYQKLSIKVRIGGKDFIISPKEQITVDVHRDVSAINAFMSEVDQKGENIQNITTIDSYFESSTPVLSDSDQKVEHVSDSFGKGPIIVYRGPGHVEFGKKDIEMKNKSKKEVLVIQVKKKKIKLFPNQLKNIDYFSDIHAQSPEELNKITKILSLEEFKELKKQGQLNQFMQKVKESMKNVLTSKKGN